MTGKTRMGAIPIAIVLALSDGSSAFESEMARIPEAVIFLGTDMDGLMTAAEACAHRHRKEKITGSCAPEDFSNELSGPRPARVASFLIDKQEVSVAAYTRCVRAGRCRAVESSSATRHFDEPELPVVSVSFYDAQSYCRFRGARLPSEAEYESAARGALGRVYPWGNLFQKGRANAGRAGARVTDERDGYELLAPTHAYPDGRTRQNVLNLSGNAAEWTTSMLGPHAAPAGERSPEARVVKGGSFADDPIRLRATARQGVPPNYKSFAIGFRCAKSILTHLPKSPEKHDGA
jgi:sulfatase modifying factor 1